MSQSYPDYIAKEILGLYPLGHSTSEIRSVIKTKYGLLISPEGIRKKLLKHEIKIRGKKEAIILSHRKKEPIKEILTKYQKGKSIRELSRKLKICRRTIKKILKENNLKIKDSRSAMISMGYIQEKKKFNLGSREKAYLHGLVMGDLTPIKKSNYTLKLITHTTHPYFADLLYHTFKKYGPASYRVNKRKEYRFQAYMDLKSFSFFLDSKKDSIPKWIDKSNFFNFLAGFIDSDGSVMIKKAGKGFMYQIRFFGQCLGVLKKVKENLERLNYNLSIHKNHSKGEVRYYKGVKFRYNKDYYALETYKKKQTLELLKQLPLRHPEKLAKKELIFSIEGCNLRYWKEIENVVKELKDKIKKSVKIKRKINLKINL